MNEIETSVEDEIQTLVSDDVEVTTFSEGDAVDVHVMFPELEETLTETLDGQSVQMYSTLKFTVARR